MSNPSHDHLPRLRAVDISAGWNQGQPALVLRDPMQLSGNYVALPRFLGPALALLDGEHEPAAIRAELRARYGLPIDLDLLVHLVDVLDQNCMLDNQRAAEALARERLAYRRAPYRLPYLAGQSYPGDPGHLRRHLDGYLAGLGNPESGTAAPVGRGVASPHIDYGRGGPVYAAVWRQARELIRAADLVILLGTDHYGPGDDRLTLTRQHYATPYGVLPTDFALVDALAEAIGPDAAFAGELRHRGEHSLELVATWLHHMRDGQPVDTLPVLTGSFMPLMAVGTDPAADPTLSAFLDVLNTRTAGRQVAVVASGDLAHVGPAFGGEPLDAPAKEAIRTADATLIDRLAAGDAAGFYRAIARIEDRNNVCGVAPFYLALHLLGDVEGRLAAYDHCPADQEFTSLVSVCGIVFG